MAAPSIERRIDDIRSAFGFSTREQKRQMFSNILETRIIILQAVLPEENPAYEKIKGLSTSISIPKESIDELTSERLKNLLKKQLDGSSGYQIQARALPEKGGFLAVKERNLDKRVKLYLNGDLNIHASLELRENEEWWQIADFLPFRLEDMDNLINLVVPHLNPQSRQLLAVPLK